MCVLLLKVINCILYRRRIQDVTGCETHTDALTNTHVMYTHAHKTWDPKASLSTRRPKPRAGGHPREVPAAAVRSQEAAALARGAGGGWRRSRASGGSSTIMGITIITRRYGMVGWLVNLCFHPKPTDKSNRPYSV